MFDQTLTEELHHTMSRLQWSRTEDNPYTDQGRRVNNYHESGLGRSRWYSYRIIEGSHDAVIEQCKFEVVRSLKQTTPMYEHMAYQVVEAVELHSEMLRIKLRNSSYAGD